MMGMGLLSLPFALKSSGWVGIGLLWLMGIVTNYTGGARQEGCHGHAWQAWVMLGCCGHGHVRMGPGRQRKRMAWLGKPMHHLVRVVYEAQVHEVRMPFTSPHTVCQGESAGSVGHSTRPRGACLSQHTRCYAMHGLLQQGHTQGQHPAMRACAPATAHSRTCKPPFPTSAPQHPQGTASMAPSTCAPNQHAHPPMHTHPGRQSAC